MPVNMQIIRFLKILQIQGVVKKNNHSTGIDEIRGLAQGMAQR
jgi:hypothetical protein